MSQNQPDLNAVDNNGDNQPGVSFVSHLIELRNRLLRAFGSVLAVFLLLALYPGSAAVYDFIASPMIQSLPQGHKMIATGVISPFLVPLKVTLLAGFLIALPYVLYQAWAFIAPALYKQEKQLVMPLIVSSTLLFFIGMAFSYFVVFHQVFGFIASVSPESINFAPDIDTYLGFVMTLFIAFGITFEVPVLVIVLVRLGVVTLTKLKEIRPYVVVGAFVIAAIITPPDVVSQFFLAVPLIILYELALMVIKYTKIGRKGDDAIDQGDQDDRANSN